MKKTTHVKIKRVAFYCYDKDLVNRLWGEVYA